MCEENHNTNDLVWENPFRNILVTILRVCASKASNILSLSLDIWINNKTHLWNTRATGENLHYKIQCLSQMFENGSFACSPHIMAITFSILLKSWCYLFNLISVKSPARSAHVCLPLLIRWNRLFLQQQDMSYPWEISRVFMSDRKVQRKRGTGAKDKNNDRTCISRRENVSLLCVRDTSGRAGRGKMLIHHCCVRQRNSTLPTVQPRDVWMCKSLSFAVSLCQRWFATALSGIAARCLGESHNSSMYFRINGALIWLVGHVCEREGACLCVCVCVCVCV